MKLGIMQPYFLPYIGYYQLIKAVDKYVIADDVHYIKQGWINRNYLLLNNNSFMFHLILKGASIHKLINEIDVEDDQTVLLKTIEVNYGKAPYYKDVFPMIEKIIEYEDKNLARYNGNSMIKIADYLQLDTEFIYSSDIKGKDCSLKAQDMVLNICMIMGATEYFNAIGGTDLYSKERFAEDHIKLSFLKMKPIEYKQFDHPFVPNLSILDVLMFNSVEQTNELLELYEFI